MKAETVLKYLEENDLEGLRFRVKSEMYKTVYLLQENRGYRL